MFHKLSDDEFRDIVHGMLKESLKREPDLQIKFEEKFNKSFPMIKQRYKRVVKKTITAKHEEIRFNYAKEKLKGCCCFEVMTDLGYRYESNFSKWFRKHAGMNPSEYQAQIKQNQLSV
ncbi:MAG TPA: helix-turn-helix domain-containing protein [Clostridiales bacterium]|nr:helix-turn-helix domain-containing protein [Clostridiales bacterium]